MRVLIAHASSKARETLTDVVRRGVDRRLGIITSDHGAETLDLLLRDDPPEVALVDWDLPEIEGPEMCRLLRDFQHGHGTHLVILAAARHVDTVDAWRAGAADCIKTPTPAEAVVTAVEKGLRAAAPRATASSTAATSASVSPAIAARVSVAAWSGDDPGDGEAAGDGHTTLEAICDQGGDDFGWDTTLRSERPEPDQPRGAALLQSLLSES